MVRIPITDRYVVGLGCRVSVEHKAGATRVNWSVSQLPEGGAPRPTGGDREISLLCPRCLRAFSVRVESAGKARTKQLVQRALGWLLVLSLLATVPVLIHLGGQTVEEGDDHSTNVFGLLFALAAVGVIVGPSLLATAGVHNGIKKLRLVRDDGRKTAWVRGHRLL
ncbi:hypothetical protein GCM10018790_58240 [Kitasatospora xanthocidica]|uniref:hypothetical protein n=1 Tax=Kitasatospora xanthocidica TaxID=83382 RepID=UPI0016798853|nr:hypothetical protein [Kitasatospora xanthocidica]GHF72717.1 hypothetical protein GCM10018790_58240 [Kitasatospora xanthocidica]